MINKYQQGGAAPQQGGEQLEQMVMQISQMVGEQPETVMAAIQAGGENFKQVIAALQQGDAQSAKQMIQQLAQQGAQMARQGAKLKFIKNLKHQCNEGEHLEYFKAGGSFGCKCVKTEKKGGKAEPKNAIQQFKEKNPKAEKCGGKMKKHQIGGTIETLRQSLGLEKKND